MQIRVLNDRSIVKDADPYGTQNENQVTTLNFIIPEEYASFNKKIVFITPNGAYWDLITNDTYIIKNNVTKYRNVSAYVWLVDVTNQIDFRSKIFYIDFNQNANPDNFIPSAEEISGYDTMIAELNDALDELEALNPISKEIVQALPTQDIDSNTIYFVPKSSPSTGYAYDKYMYINNAWENMDGSGVDLTDYVKNTDYATNSTGGVIKVGANAISISNGLLTAETRTYQNYESAGNTIFIGKGTLENVLNARIGDINTMLDTINGEVI